VEYQCKRCDGQFVVKAGGGFFFDVLHCEKCGRDRSVRHADMGDVHLAFVKGLPGPYAVTRAAMDREIQATYPGEPLDRAGYHAAVEASLKPCACGGRFRYDAAARCPTCRSTAEWWEPTKGVSMLYD
jgi:hypothetical protein